MHNSAKVFLLSGDAFYAKFYSIFLQHMGYENTSSFYSSKECLNQLSEKPDVIFLDTNDIRSNDNIVDSIRRVNQSVPIVMIADNSSAIARNGVVFLPKSGITPEAMGETLETLLTSSN